MRPRFFAFAAPLIAIAAIALVVAGCGGNDDNSSTTSGGQSTVANSGGASTNSTGGGTSTARQTTTARQAPPAAARGTGTAIRTARSPDGTILVDSTGRALYLWEADTGTSSTCTGECAAQWPPLTTRGRPTASGGAEDSRLGTSRRSDGSTQVTYNGHPLYFFAGDSGPGQENGQGSDAFGAPWWVVNPAGEAVTS
jgi:predicted lipoprotein with Yx(FWY)xxD motif